MDKIFDPTKVADVKVNQFREYVQQLFYKYICCGRVLFVCVNGFGRLVTVF